MSPNTVPREVKADFLTITEHGVEQDARRLVLSALAWHERGDDRGSAHALFALWHGDKSTFGIFRGVLFGVSPLPSEGLFRGGSPASLANSGRARARVLAEVLPVDLLPNDRLDI